MRVIIPNLNFKEIDQFENYDAVLFEHAYFILIIARMTEVRKAAELSRWDSYEKDEINRCRIEKRLSEKITGKWCAKQAYQFVNNETIHIHADSHAPRIVKNGKQLNDWFVSISHSHGYVGAALSRSKIGFDLEKQRFFKDSLIRFFCNEIELARLSNLSDKEKQKCTLQLFCGKEAILKTLGLGIAGGPEKATLEELRSNEWIDAKYQSNQYELYFTRPKEMGLCICLDSEKKPL